MTGAVKEAERAAVEENARSMLKQVVKGRSGRRRRNGAPGLTRGGKMDYSYAIDEPSPFFA